MNASPPTPLALTPIDAEIDSTRLDRWLLEEGDRLSAEVERRGVLLLRGPGPLTAHDFASIARRFCGELCDYDIASTPRTALREHVYTSTEYPADQAIALHCEQSYTSRFPRRLAFHCERPAPRGGDTPLADMTQVYARLPERLRERFERDGLVYVRNFHEGLDVPWHTVFGTHSRDELERICEERGIRCEWSAAGTLRIEEHRPAVLVHPTLRVPVWFNQANLFHDSALAPDLRDALRLALGDRCLPRLCYHGDGSVIEDDDLDAVREAIDACTTARAWQAGDVLVVDNLRVAHGRTPYTGERRVWVAMGDPLTTPCNAARREPRR